jgi:hypothetical protein
MMTTDIGLSLTLGRGANKTENSDNVAGSGKWLTFLLE